MDRLSAWRYASAAPIRRLLRRPDSRGDREQVRTRGAHPQPAARPRFEGASLIAAVTLLVVAPSLAVAQILNGDFSAGLTDWMVEPGGGAVSVIGGAAVLDEDFTVGFTALSQSFSIPVNAGTLTFDFEYATIPDATSNGFPDAFSAFLLAPGTDVSLVAGAGLGEEYINIDGGGGVALSSGTTLDGSGAAGTVTLDLTGVPVGPATLLFEPVGSDDGRTSTVTLDNVRIVLHCPISPADVNGNLDIEPSEISGYGTCFLQMCTNWAGGGPLPPPPAYVSRMGTLFLRGGFGRIDHCCDPLKAPPMGWVEPGDCTASPAIAGAEAFEATGEAAATRAFQRRGSTVNVRLQVRPPSRSTAYAIEERLPAGMVATAVSHGGIYHAEFGSIRWGPFLDRASRDLTYEVTPSNGRERSGPLEGIVAFDGHTVSILGQDTILWPPGDADRDGDVDLADFLKMAECLSSIEAPDRTGCAVFDFDGDGDVDLADVVAFQSGLVTIGE